jgi:hypothetical protein
MLQRKEHFFQSRRLVTQDLPHSSTEHVGSNPDGGMSECSQNFMPYIPMCVYVTRKVIALCEQCITIYKYLQFEN